jgi:hypothetical protein
VWVSLCVVASKAAWLTAAVESMLVPARTSGGRLRVVGVRAQTSGVSSRSKLAVAILCVLAFSGFGCASAFGAQTRNLINTFGSLSNPQGVTIDQSSGDVYVADTANNRIEKFDALGNFLLAFGADVGGTGVDTCTSELTCAAGTQGSAPGQFTTAQFLAADNSAGPSAGDVYVADTGDNLVSKFDSSGNLIGSWGSGGQLDGSSTGAGSFGSLAGAAVDATGTLYVFNTSKQVFEFEQDGTFASELGLKSEQGTAPLGFAVDGAGDLFKVNGGGEVEKFDAAGTDLGTITTGGASAFALEPASGDLYVAGLADTLQHYAFNGSGEVLQPGGGTCVPVPGGQGCGPTDSVAISFAATGIAVSSATGDSYLSNATAGKVYQYGPLVTIPDVTTGPATEITPTSARLNGTVNPAGLALSECAFEYVDAEEYEPTAPNPYAAGQSAPCEEPDAAEVGSGTEPVEVHANITGLTPGASYHFRLKAANANGPNFGSDEVFSTPPPPSIDSATVSNLSASSAQLNAQINPQGAETHYRFEYGTSTAYGTTVPIPDGVIAAGFADVSVSEHIELERANETYHWRVVASNASGTTKSSDHTFIYTTTGVSLPDGRAYEMVTPPQKNGALIGDVSPFGGEPSIAANGSRVIASSIQCFAGAQSCNGQHGDGVGSPYSFTRTSSGWVTTPLAPPATTFPQNTPWDYSAETGMALFSMPTAPLGQDDFYARQNDGSFLDLGPNTPPEEGARGPIGGKTRGITQAHTADFSHFAWMTEARWPFDEREAGFIFDTYEYAGAGNSQPLLVGVSGGEGSTDLIGVCGINLGGDPTLAFPGSLSDDGRTVYFTALTEGGGAGGPCPSGSGANAGTPVPANAVYVRIDGERSDAHTVAISSPSPSECGGGEAAGEKACREAATKPAGAQFIGATSDGSKAFFASTQQLTDGASEDGNSGDNASLVVAGCASTTGPNGCNLYEYDFANPTGHKLIDVSGGDSSGGGPRVQGVMALSPDATHTYFVAKGVLATAANDEGEKAKDGASNLYVFERDAAHPAGQTTFITGLATSDSGEWTTKAGLPANVTPDGRFLVFVSHARLTGDDTSVGGAQQVFRYDAQTGALERISIGNDGFNDNGNRSAPTPCATNSCSEDAQIAGAAVLQYSRDDPSMSDDGRFVFFSSPVALAPGALEDVQITSEEGRPIYAMNVYEWHEGHVYLISDGRDVSVNNGEAPLCTPALSSTCLLGSDASGANVFFSTTDKLVGQDTDTELDYYDARICSSASPCLDQSPSPTVICQEDACQGSPIPQPPLASAASVSFSGPGNASPPAPTPVGKVKLLRHAVRGSSFLLTVSVPAKGQIAITGNGVGPLRRSLARAGSYRFAVSLTAKARAALHRRHGHKMTIHLHIAYTPASGPPSSANLTLTVKR